MISEKEQLLPAEARKGPQEFYRLLAEEPAPVDPRKIEPVVEPELMRKLITSTMEESVALDRKAMEMADRARALEDSAATVGERDQVIVQRMAMRSREMSDSLRTGSLLKGQEARQLEIHERQVILNDLFRTRLVKFYYLDVDEQVIIMQVEDISRYFQIKARALEQHNAASGADSAASLLKGLIVDLQKEAAATEDQARNGKLSAAEATETSMILTQRAGALTARTDSLNNVAEKLRQAARANEQQADLILQGMDQQDASDLKGLELRTRRTSGQILELRPAVAPEPGINEDTPVVSKETQPSKADEVTISEPLRSPELVDVQPVDKAIEVPIEKATSEIGSSVTPKAPATGERTFVLPKELVTDIFELRPPGERVAQPILMNEALPSGIIYKVQIGAFRNQIEKDVFSDMTPVMGEDAGNGLTRYTAGLFTSFDQAFVAKDKVRGRGYRDAFVVAYRNGGRVPLGEAMRASRSDLASATAPASRLNEVGVNNANEPTPTVRSASESEQTPVDRIAQRTSDPDPIKTGDPIAPDRAVEDSVPSQTHADIDPNKGSTVNRQAPDVIASPPGSVKNADQPSTGNTSNASVEQVPADREAVPAVALTIPPVSEREEIQRILKSYPPSPAEIKAQFSPDPSAVNYYPVSGVAPARPVEMIMGLFFTVQVGVYTKPVALDKLYNITPLVSELTETKKIRYSTGVFTDMETARARRLQIVDIGVQDAFITAYLNGKRIPIRDGIALLEEHGPGVLAQP
ncbi:MAG: hypothetical protein M3R08_07075 [Bacteroidota bacterium]|nr:hypothetical protein [Bacteroidota bacterium]